MPTICTGLRARGGGGGCPGQDTPPRKKTNPGLLITSVPKMFERDQENQLTPSRYSASASPGHSWPQVTRRTGLGQGTAYRAFRKAVEALKTFQNPKAAKLTAATNDESRPAQISSK